MKTLQAIAWFLILSTTLVSAPAPAQSEDPPVEPPAPAADASEMTLENRCRLEVEELHQFFQDWTTAAIEAADENFDRFASVTAESFAIISPSGRMTERQTILDRMRGAHGQTPAEDARIWIENFQLRSAHDGVAVVTYVEWQEIGGQKRGRLSTAVLRARADARNGVEWLHVHQTWLPP